MKLIALFGAAAMAVGALTAVPAEAQRDGYRDGRGSQGSYADRDHRGYREGGRYRQAGPRWNRGYRSHGGYRARGRVVCRLDRGRHGRVRHCFRVYR